MAIKPPSDLVLDVSRAADPLEYRASVEKLRNGQSAVRAINQEINDTGFAELASITELDLETLPNKPVDQVKVNMSSDRGNNAEAYRKFEAFMLQTFIQNMFTSDTPSVFGKGQAGEFWKSMMAESMAKEMADYGGIGVARMLENDQRIKQGNIAINNDFTSLNNSVTSSRIDTNPQATADNIIHRNEIDLVRQRMTKNS